MASIWQLLELHRPALAETAARQRLAADPADWPTLLALTEALRQQQRLEEAAYTATTAIQAEPNAHEAHFALAQALGMQGKLRRADISLRQALRLSHREPRYHAFRAQLFYLQRSYNAAISCAEDGLQLAPEHADCLLWRALAQECLDQPAAADDDFQRLLRVAPESDLVHARLGRVLFNRYQPAAADRHLTEALRQNPALAAELVPLLREARRQQLWPEWLLRSERQGAERRALGLDPGLGMLFHRIRGTGAVTRAWWRTRRAPLFRHPLPPNPHSRWRWRLKVWGVVLAIIGGVIGLTALSVQLGLPAMTGIMVGSGLLAIARYLNEQRDDDD
ncbi:tetratricopeptide repeat protein [Hymenobacter armeniacus]|uniref:tetratricopeptide repeat protein n=1 Tax=Hymenobacter armeniacus TaxID=2771358 RepID=UPI00168909CD|nr:tetratricopeptide repeat protein [Hymenobacter armeniacus]